MRCVVNQPPRPRRLGSRCRALQCKSTEQTPDGDVLVALVVVAARGNIGLERALFPPDTDGAVTCLFPVDGDDDESGQGLACFVSASVWPCAPQSDTAFLLQLLHHVLLLMDPTVVRPTVRLRATFFRSRTCYSASSLVSAAGSQPASHAWTQRSPGRLVSALLHDRKGATEKGELVWSGLGLVEPLKKPRRWTYARRMNSAMRQNRRQQR